jgi:flagellar biosynthesis/type III secretory pathway protein FliH
MSEPRPNGLFVFVAVRELKFFLGTLALLLPEQSYTRKRIRGIKSLQNDAILAQKTECEPCWEYKFSPQLSLQSCRGKTTEASAEACRSLRRMVLRGTKECERYGTNMRSPPPPLGTDHHAFECRVRFPGRLVGAAIAPIEVTPVPRSQVRVAPAPPVSPHPASAPEQTPQAPSGQQPPLRAESGKAELDRELKADRDRIATVLNNLNSAIAELRKDQSERLLQWQRAAVELAMTIATRLLHEKVVSGDFPMEAKVRDMLQQLEDEAPVAVRLNPEDLKLLESRLGNEPLLPGQDNPRLVPDTTLARGECRLEGKETMLLSDVGRELAEIRDELLRSLAHARS